MNSGPKPALRWAVLALLCCLCAGCSGGGISKIRIDSIIGVVYSTATGLPLSGAAVTVTGVIPQLTNASGRFEFTNILVPSICSIEISAAGHITVSYDLEPYSGVYYELAVDLPFDSAGGPGSSSLSGRAVMGNTYPPIPRALSLGRPVSAASGAGAIASDRVVVAPTGSVSLDTLRSKLKADFGATEISVCYAYETPFVVVAPPADCNHDEFLSAVVDKPYVKYAHFDVKVAALGLATSDPEFDRQWYLYASSFPAAWRQARYRRSVVILDSGIDPTHPDMPSTMGGYDFVDNDSYPYDDPLPGTPSHGTAVHSVIAAMTDNGIGMSSALGIAHPTVLHYRVLGPDGTGWESDVAAALTRYVSTPAVFNMSFGRPGEATQVLDEAIRYVRKVNSNSVLVAAAGNNGGDVLCPANHDLVLAVAANDAQGRLASYSNSGPGIFCSAPGGPIVGSNLGSDGILAAWSSPGKPHGYSFWGGTSMACALASAFACFASPVGYGVDIYALLPKYLVDTGRSYPEINAFTAVNGLYFADRDPNKPREHTAVVALLDSASDPTHLTSGAGLIGSEGKFRVPGALPGKAYMFGWFDSDYDGMFSDFDYVLVPFREVSLPDSGELELTEPIVFSLWSHVLMAQRRAYEDMDPELVESIVSAAQSAPGSGGVRVISKGRKGGR